MGLSKDIKNLSEEILTSYRARAQAYQQRLKENENLVAEVQKTLETFRKDHLEMAANLRQKSADLKTSLKEEDNLRLNTLNELMNGIRQSISKIQKEVEDIQQSTSDLLTSFSKIRKNTAGALKEQFAREQTNRAQQRAQLKEQNEGRLKTFEDLMRGIRDELKQSQEEVNKITTAAQELLQRYDQEHSQMSDALREKLSNNLDERTGYTRQLLKGFHDQLVEISRENQEMGKTLRNLLLQSREELAVDDEERIKAFDNIMGDVRHWVKTMQNTIDDTLKNWSNERELAAAEWQKLSGKIKQMSNGNSERAFEPTVSPAAYKSAKREEDIKTSEDRLTKKEPVAEVKESAPKTEKAAVNEEAAAGNKEKKPAKAEKKETYASPDMSLDEKVIAYINAHPEGVRVSEMEKPLGEQRMRIGYVCKKLLEDGKLTKLENAYFPKAHSDNKESTV